MILTNKERAAIEKSIGLNKIMQEIIETVAEKNPIADWDDAKGQLDSINDQLKKVLAKSDADLEGL